KLTGLQMEKLQFLYEQMVEDNELMKELEDIINYSTSTIKRAIRSGTEIYEFIEGKIIINPIGLVPLDTNEGYFFLTSGKKNISVYYYRLSFFEKHDEKYRSIKTVYIDMQKRSMANTYERIKADLIRNRGELPNPAVYSVETSLNFPLYETLLPVAKRS